MGKLICLLVLAGTAFGDESFVFVREDRTVALHQSGKQTPVLFGRGREPALSPDGRYVLYRAAQPGKAFLMLGDVATGTSALWRAGNLRSPQFSPDGKSVLWTEISGGRWTVMLSPVDQPAPRALFSGKDGVFNPAWQPDGKGIIAADVDALYFVSLDGKLQRSVPVRELTGGTALVSSADRFRLRPGHPGQVLFSAAVEAPALGKQIFDGGWSALFLYDLDEKTCTRLTPDEVFATEPAWSTDGMGLYARGLRVGAHPLRQGILHMNAKGKNVERVAPGEEPGTTATAGPRRCRCARPSCSSDRTRARA